MKRLAILMLSVLCFLMLGVMGCDDDKPKKLYTYHVKLTHPDGTVQNWILKQYEIEEGFLKWNSSNGSVMSISGSITVTPVVYNPPKLDPKPEPEKKKVELLQDGEMP